MKLIAITDCARKAKIFEEAGVDRIMVDLETHGKAERQSGRSTIISAHRSEEIPAVLSAVERAEVMVRVNPWGSHSVEEVETVLEHKPHLLMLPMFHRPEEVSKFVDLVAGRARIVALLETASAFIRVEDILEVSGIGEYYIGLNDLTISLGLDFVFEPLAYGVVDVIAARLRSKRIEFGFGGIATLDGGVVPGRVLVSEHVRVGSSRVILSRAFVSSAGENLGSEIRRLREEWERCSAKAADVLEEQRLVVRDLVVKAARRVTA